MARPGLNTVVLDFVGAAGVSLVNIPKALSLANRKSFRQGYVYSVDFIEVIAPAQQVFTIGKIPENYNTLGAYKLGFHVWKQQRAEAIDESGIEPGKWSDFKPWFSDDHRSGVITELNVKGLSAGGTLQSLDVTGSEWNMADIAISDLDPTGGVTTTSVLPVGMLGDDNGSLYGSLINAWGETRAQTLSPDPLISNQAHLSWITRTGDGLAEHTSDVITLIDTENDIPPYANQADTTLPPTYVGNGQSAPGGMMVDTTTTGSTGRPVSMDGGLFPLGYLVIHNAGEDAYTLRVHCTRGSYKGVAALPMGDFS